MGLVLCPIEINEYPSPMSVQWPFLMSIAPYINSKPQGNGYPTIHYFGGRLRVAVFVFFSKKKRKFIKVSEIY